MNKISITLICLAAALLLRSATIAQGNLVEIVGQQARAYANN